MIASLPMYARSANRAAHDALWALIRDGLQESGIAAPDRLDHDIAPMDGWAHPDLVVGQICNLPLRRHFMDDVTLIGAADYALPDCLPGYYRSVFVTRSDTTANTPLDLIGARFVVNDAGSQSGYGAAQLWAKTHGAQFVPQLFTGSHKGSINAVSAGQGDIAAIDAQTWRIEQHENPNTSALKVIGQTDATPGMTFITRKGQDPAPYFDAIQTAIKALPRDAAVTLGLRDIVALNQSAYDLPLPPELQPNRG